MGGDDRGSFNEICCVWTLIKSFAMMQNLTRLGLVFLLAVCCRSLVCASPEEQQPAHSLGSGVEDEVVDMCVTEEEINADVKVASIQFDEVGTALYVVCFVLVAIFAKMGKLLMLS